MPVNVVCVGVRGIEKPVNVVLEQPVTVELFKQRLHCLRDVYLCCGGEPLADSDVIGKGADYSTTIINVHHQVIGGKGGFGSLIRATRSHINKSSNRSACRDISGRRMRDVRAEKKISDWIAAEPERKRQRAEKKMKRLKRLTEQPKHKFDDHSYMEQIKDTEEGMVDSLKQGLAAAVAGKRTREDNGHGEPSKKPKMWMESEELESSDSDGEISDDEGDSASPSSERSDQRDIIKSECNDTTGAGPSTVVDCVSERTAVEIESCVSERTAVEIESCVSERTVETDNMLLVRENDDEPLDLAKYSSEEELLAVGGDGLKAALQKLGLKCGGTPQERAHRLFSTKGKSLDELDPSLFAKKSKKKRN